MRETYVQRKILKHYQTNACCNPEYAMRGIINSIRMSKSGAMTNFDCDTKEEQKLIEESVDEVPSLSSLLRRKHSSIVPKVMLQRNTINSKLVPPVLPFCKDTSSNQ